jgi:epoxyqueuosine reductase
MPDLNSLKEFVKRAAAESGFDLVGVAGVRDFPELEHFPRWVAAGHAGEMSYLEARNHDGNLKRAALRNVAPWARSVIVCAINYNTSQPYSTQAITQAKASQRGWISRYAWSRRDYHDVVVKKLKQVEANISAASGNGTGHGEQPRTRCYVDTGPLVERVYAKYAGVGWIGKNTCILNQRLGSWLFLGVILTSLELTPDLPAANRCGTCRRCIEACPTDALIAPYQLDSNRCISYVTIEKRGEIPEAMRAGIGRHVFGCDICQDVCPWNRRSPVTAEPDFQPRPGLVNPALDWLAEMTSEQFANTFRGSPVRRAKLSGLRRNAVVAMGNSGDPELVPKLEKLAQDADAVVASHARWAAAKLKKQTAVST